MKSKKSILRHELLNVLTTVSLLINKDEINKDDRMLLNELVKRISSLLSFDDIFLQKRPKFIEQKVSLKEMLEIVLLDVSADKNCSLEKISDDMILFVDRFYVQEALSGLINRLLECSSSLKCTYNLQRRTLVIEHEADLFSCEKRGTLIDHLVIKTKGADELLFQLALNIFEVCGLKLLSKKGIVEIVFPESVDTSLKLAELEK